MDFICDKAEHDQQRIKYICVDQICSCDKKIGCADCFLENHLTHQRKTLSAFKESLQLAVSTIKAGELSQIAIAKPTEQKNHKALDKEVEFCFEQIKQRFNMVVNDIKDSLSEDLQRISDCHTQYTNNLNNEVNPITDLCDQEFPQLEAQQIQHLIRFYQDSNKIFNHYNRSAEIIKDEKHKVKLKKQKSVLKFRSVMSVLLKEFNELMNSNQIDDFQYQSPQRSLTSQSLIDTVRANRYPITSQKKRYIRQKQ